MNLVNDTITVKAKLVFGIFDLPAKAVDGKFGCSVCLHPGKQLSNRRMYPPRRKPAELRTHEAVVSLAEEATRCGKVKKGIKGISPSRRYSR